MRERAKSCGWRSVRARDSDGVVRALSAGNIALAIVQAGFPGIDIGQLARLAAGASTKTRLVFVGDCPLDEARQSLPAGPLDAMSHEGLLRSLAVMLLGSDLEPAPPAATFCVGSAVRICVLSGSLAGTYDGSVVDSGPQHLSASAWDLRGAPLDLSLGAPVTVGFAGPQGWGEMRSAVTGSYVRGSVIELTLSRSAEISYRQRRQAERHVATYPIWAWPAEGADLSSQMASGRTEDISMSGVRACFTDALPFTGRAVLAIIPARPRKASRLLAESVWHEELPGSGEHRYAFRFTNVTGAAADQLDALIAATRSRSGVRAARKTALADERGAAAPGN
ncbi:MAG: PilZ domain-containing protein [Armatimonadota bacterium]